LIFPVGWRPCGGHGVRGTGGATFGEGRRADKEIGLEEAAGAGDGAQGGMETGVIDGDRGGGLAQEWVSA
jgi:hypothetical protein